jgi:hypothetical protein
MLWLMAVPLRRVRVGVRDQRTPLSNNTLSMQVPWLDTARYEKSTVCMLCALGVVSLLLPSHMDVFPSFQAIESAQRQKLKSPMHELHCSFDFTIIM